MEKINEDIEILKKRGFWCIRKSKDGTYIAEDSKTKTKYFGLYIDNGVIRQR